MRYEFCVGNEIGLGNVLKMRSEAYDRRVTTCSVYDSYPELRDCGEQAEASLA